MPHADDASSGPAWRPGHDHESGIQPPDGDESRLAVITPQIRASEMRAGKDFVGTTHVQAAILQRQQPLVSIAGDAHGIIVATLIAAVKTQRGRFLKADAVFCQVGRRFLRIPLELHDRFLRQPND